MKAVCLETFSSSLSNPLHCMHYRNSHATTTRAMFEQTLRPGGAVYMNTYINQRVNTDTRTVGMIQPKKSHSSTICYHYLKPLLFLKNWKWTWAKVNVSSVTAWCNTTERVYVAFCSADTHCHNTQGRWRQLTPLTITVSLSITAMIDYRTHYGEQ